MSRIGKKPVTIPSGVKAAVNSNTITIEGPKGKLNYSFDANFKVAVKDNAVTVTRPSDAKHLVCLQLLWAMTIPGPISKSRTAVILFVRFVRSLMPAAGPAAGCLKIFSWKSKSSSLPGIKSWS